MAFAILELSRYQVEGPFITVRYLPPSPQVPSLCPKAPTSMRIGGQEKEFHNKAMEEKPGIMIGRQVDDEKQANAFLRTT
ncbi:hypothetical protein HYC85_025675 [Camellia sinensis]|uniref:Uncharacterized protein n=1 Tax=Camellia sinensis TaxID=4442 RepID=A0A7J7GBN8_CAMSI|nr:hypothetical protein HYC85_025675 [Camellia sinensis]